MCVCVFVCAYVSTIYGSVCGYGGLKGTPIEEEGVDESLFSLKMFSLMSH